MSRAMRLLVPLGLFVLAAAADSDGRPEAPTPAAVEIFGWTPTAESVEALPLPPSLPSLSADVDLSRSGAAEPVAVLPGSRVVDHRHPVVDAQVLEKYRAFRESLTTP